jgi:hypothetical protein
MTKAIITSKCQTNIWGRPGELKMAYLDKNEK